MKPKLTVDPKELVVARESANGRSFLADFEDPLRKIDPLKLLRSAKIRCLRDEDKPKYIVIKFAYVLYNPRSNEIGLFARVDDKHSQCVGSHSLLLSSGLEEYYGAMDMNGLMVLNSYAPFTRKLGALVNEFDIPFTQFKEIPYPVRFVSVVMRRMPNGRLYAFFVHLALLANGSRFPPSRFVMSDPDASQSRTAGDEFQGFFPLREATSLLNQTDFLVDKAVLSMLSGKVLKLPDLELLQFKPRGALTGFGKRMADSITFSPQIPGVGLGINIKKLFGWEH